MVAALVALARKVSILYEANEVCNLDTMAYFSSNVALFQSSTRLTRFATPPGCSARTRTVTVSILYEANEVCNVRTSSSSPPPP